MGLNSKLMMLLLMIGHLRIWEASNPGPAAQFDDGRFSLGTFNPSGLRNKAKYFQSQLSAGDVWTVVETHCFGKMLPGSGLACVHPDRNTGIASQTRPLSRNASPRSLPGRVFQCCQSIRLGLCPPAFHLRFRTRAIVWFTTMVQDVWISGAVMYGATRCFRTAP